MTKQKTEAEWAAIELTYMDTDNYCQLSFRWVTDADYPTHREYRIISKLEGKLSTKMIETPDDTKNRNKREAYDAYWTIEEKLLAL